MSTTKRSQVQNPTLLLKKQSLAKYFPVYNLSPTDSPVHGHRKDPFSMTLKTSPRQRMQKKPSDHLLPEISAYTTRRLIHNKQRQKHLHERQANSLMRNQFGGAHVEFAMTSRRVSPGNNLHTRYPSIQCSNVGIINPNNTVIYSDLWKHIKKKPLRNPILSPANNLVPNVARYIQE